MEDQKEGRGGAESLEMVGKMLLFSSCIDLNYTQIHTKLHWGKQSAVIFTFSDIQYSHFFMILLSVRWEEEKYEDGVKWKFLEHVGPYFPPEYQPLPDNVHFYYNGQLSKKLYMSEREI